MSRFAKFLSCFPVLLLGLNLGYSEAGYFKYRKLTKGKELSFPVFFRLNDSSTTEKINQLLQLSELELLEGYQTKHIFEKACADNGGIYGGMVEISYRILANNPKVLSIELNEASCGATCKYWVRYYSFNSGNGDLIQLKDLFTDSGFAVFRNKILEKRTARFKKAIQKIDSQWRSNLMYVLDEIKSDYLQDYYIKDSSIYINSWNFLHKNDKAWDLDMITKFRLSEFKDYLNDYGKTAFGVIADSISKFRSNELPQLFHGTLGTNGILLVINHDYDNKMRALYAYKRYGRGIFLEGEFKDPELTMTEYSADRRENAHINATFDGKKMVGSWTSKEGTKTLEFYVQRK